MDHFAALLNNQFEKKSNSIALIYHDERITFGQLAQRVYNVSAFLRAQGLSRGERVVLYTADKFPFLILHLGIILSGGVSVPLNHNFTEDEMRYFLQDSSARFACTSPREAPMLQRLRTTCPTLQHLIVHGTMADFPPGTPNDVSTIHPEDYCFMLYSSGTTGRPKGVPHTHRNVAASLIALQQWWNVTPDDVLLNVLPLYHLHGLSFAAHLSLISGSCMMLEDSFLHTIDKLRDATVFMAIPTMYYDLLRRPEFRERAPQWKRMRLFTCGSAPIRPEVLPELESIIRAKLINRYGMTESHVITSMPLDTSHTSGSVGVPIDGIEMKLVTEDGAVLSAGARQHDGSPRVGEILVRSENLFHQYWNQPEATAKAFDNEGFFLTGDLGTFDEAGHLTLVGRKSDLIIVHGENVYPPIVERVLNAFAQVKESAVVGVPDLRSGERVVAFIVSNGALDVPQLRRHCEEKLIHFQRPTQIELIESLPRNTMGKVLKRILRERLIPRTIAACG